MRVKEKFNSKLLVEGNDDQHVIWALCERFRVPENFDVIDCEGIDNIYEQLPVRFKQSAIDSLGIIIDADVDLQMRWDSLAALLIKQGYSTPTAFPQDGFISKNAENKRIGVWIMPDNKLNGMLEDFIAFLVPQHDELLPIVYDSLKDIEIKRLNKYSLKHKSKAAIHTWLAWQDDPGTPLGLAITKRYLTSDQKICLQFINWISQLFGQE
jgi:hypothetical protein